MASPPRDASPGGRTEGAEDPAAERPSSRRDLLGGLAAVVLGGVGFASGTRIVERASPAHIPVLSAKLAYLRSKRARRVTTLFIGTSRVYRHVVPQVVDQLLEDAGHREGTFNLGAPRLVGAEIEWMLDAIVASPPPALRRVIVETQLYEDDAPKTYGTSRHVAWHTSGATVRFLRHILGQTPDRAKIVERLGIDGGAWGRNVTALGRLAERFRIAWDPSFDDDEEDDSEVQDGGYRPLETETAPGVRHRRARFKKQHRALEAATKARVRKPGARRDLSPYQESVLERIVARTRAAGLEPILFESPVPKLPVRLRSATLRAVPGLFMNDPVAYPELYQPDLHFDWGHLNRQGAATMSAHLGGLLVRHLAGEHHFADGGDEAETAPLGDDDPPASEDE